MNNNIFSLSILIPTFNRPQKLDKLLHSIKLNNLDSLCRYEIRIYDNNSEKDYSRVISKYDHLNIIYKKHSKNIGSKKNFYRLQKDSEMDWFCIISDDDYIENNHFIQLIKLVEKYPKSFFACNNTKVLNGNKFNKSPSMKSNYWKNNSFHNPSTQIMWKMYLNHFVSTGCIFRKIILKDLFLDDDDRIFLTELASKYPFCTSKKATAILTIHPDTISGRGGPRVNYDFKGLLESLSRKIENAHNIHKENKNKAVNLSFIIFYEYMIDFSKLAIKENLKFESPKFCFEKKFFIIKLVLAIYFIIRKLFKFYFIVKL